MLFPQHLYSMFRFSVLQKVHLLQSQIADACFHGLKPVLAMLIFKESEYLCYSLVPHDHKSELNC